MENILVVGTNNRPVACSLSKLGYNIYSVDHFGCLDIKPCVKEYNSFLSQKPFHSSGFLQESFKQNNLEQMAKEFLGEVDHIICCSGVDPAKFPKNKIIGNKDISSVHNKYKFYKTLKNRFEGLFKLPETFMVKDFGEVHEILEDFPEKNFLLKPLIGSGGVGIRKPEEDDPTIDFNNVILQEIIEGVDLSTSVISSGDEAQTIITNQQLIGKKSLGQIQNYGYCGNISPCPQLDNGYNENNLKEISEEIILGLDLIGSNGVDMIYNNGEVYVIEVNPRLQGTFEAVEASLNLNMAEVHINACQGLFITPKPTKFAIKMVVFARNRSLVGNMKIEGVHDIPGENVIIEKGEPVATVLTSGMVLEDTVYTGKKIVSFVYQNLEKY